MQQEIRLHTLHIINISRTPLIRILLLSIAESFPLHLDFIFGEHDSTVIPHAEELLLQQFVVTTRIFVLAFSGLQQFFHLIMVPKISTKVNSKSKTIQKVKRTSDKKNIMPIYKAVPCPRPAIAPSMKFPRQSVKWNAYVKIVKLLTNKDDQSLSEAERSAALNLGLAQCRRYDIDMDQALLEVEYRKNEYKGGSSSVLIKRNDNQLHKNVRTQTFLIDLCDAMEMMFDCHAYTELDKGRLRITFYGVDKHTVTAQIAFVNAYNQAANMGQVYRGSAPKNSYLLGVAKGT